MANTIKTKQPTYEDLRFLHSIAALDWTLAASPVFQQMIRDLGSYEEQGRLANANVGYIMPGWACQRRYEEIRASGELQRILPAFKRDYWELRAKYQRVARQREKRVSPQQTTFAW